MNSDTIRTVIEIVPDWDIDRYSADEPEFLSEADGEDWSYNEDCIYLDSIPRIFLDALAAAAVRVVDGMPNVKVSPHKGFTILSPTGKPRDEFVKRGPNRTENTLEAIAEFVKGGFERE